MEKKKEFQREESRTKLTERRKHFNLFICPKNGATHSLIYTDKFHTDYYLN